MVKINHHYILRNLLKVKVSTIEKTTIYITTSKITLTNTIQCSYTAQGYYVLICTLLTEVWHFLKNIR